MVVDSMTMLRKVQIGLLVVLAVAVVAVWSLHPETPPAYASRITAARVWAAADDHHTVALFVGDSYTAGALDVSSGNTYAPLTCQTLGWECNIDAEGGTGYVANGHANSLEFEPYIDRLASDVATYRADVVVVTGGRNDVGVSGEAEAVLRYLREVRNDFPKATLVVVEPFWIEGDPTQGIAQVRADTAAGAKSVGATYLSTEGWITRSMIGNDNVHPTAAGHIQIAAKLAAAIGVVHIGSAA